MKKKQINNGLSGKTRESDSFEWKYTTSQQYAQESPEAEKMDPPCFREWKE